MECNAPIAVTSLGIPFALFAPLCGIEVARRCPGMQDGPLVCLLRESLRVLKHHFGDLGILRIFGIRELEKHAEGKKSRLDCLDGRPAGPQGVEADGALSTLVEIKTVV